MPLSCPYSKPQVPLPLGPGSEFTNNVSGARAVSLQPAQEYRSPASAVCVEWLLLPRGGGKEGGRPPQEGGWGIWDGGVERCAVALPPPGTGRMGERRGCEAERGTRGDGGSSMSLF